mmetsp:Transcript_45558/g.99220  ORF Transcript_45558/g.99220 Transcript_45558/m.99220 type:complete len:297 (-) Transcript_45558:189-1079(-)
MLLGRNHAAAAQQAHHGGALPGVGEPRHAHGERAAARAVERLVRQADLAVLKHGVKRHLDLAHPVVERGDVVVPELDQERLLDELSEDAVEGEALVPLRRERLADRLGAHLLAADVHSREGVRQPVAVFGLELVPRDQVHFELSVLARVGRRQGERAELCGSALWRAVSPGTGLRPASRRAASRRLAGRARRVAILRATLRMMMMMLICARWLRRRVKRPPADAERDDAVAAALERLVLVQVRAALEHGLEREHRAAELVVWPANVMVPQLDAHLVPAKLGERALEGERLVPLRVQ